MILLLLATTFSCSSDDAEKEPVDPDSCSLADEGMLVACNGADSGAAECDCADAIIDLDSRPDCEVDLVCGDVIGVDCGAATDGDYIYYDSEGTAIEFCGGSCWTPGPGVCEQCPPVDMGWTC
jgi:hypothetical protein